MLDLSYDTEMAFNTQFSHLNIKEALFFWHNVSKSIKVICIFNPLAD